MVMSVVLFHGIKSESFVAARTLKASGVSKGNRFSSVSIQYLNLYFLLLEMKDYVPSSPLPSAPVCLFFFEWGHVKECKRALLLHLGHLGSKMNFVFLDYTVRKLSTLQNRAVWKMGTRAIGTLQSDVRSHVLEFWEGCV